MNYARIGGALLARLEHLGKGSAFPLAGERSELLQLLRAAEGAVAVQRGELRRAGRRLDHRSPQLNLPRVREAARFVRQQPGFCRGAYC